MKRAFVKASVVVMVSGKHHSGDVHSRERESITKISGNLN